MIARSSQIRSTERREGRSMAEVVMDDMAIGNPVSPMAQLVALWASFPGIHIAQFPFQVIGNCGVISLMQCSNRRKSRKRVPHSPCGVHANDAPPCLHGAAAINAGWRDAQYDGIVAMAAGEHFGRRLR